MSSITGGRYLAVAALLATLLIDETAGEAGKALAADDALSALVEADWAAQEVGKSITGTATYPGRIGADESRFTKILADSTHAKTLRIPPEDLQRLYIWLDGNAPFYGTYEKESQRLQLRGASVVPPEVQ